VYKLLKSNFLRNKHTKMAHSVFIATILSVVTYALPSFAGHLSIEDKVRLDSLFRKAFRRGFLAKPLLLTSSYRLEIK